MASGTFSPNMADVNHEWVKSLRSKTDRSWHQYVAGRVWRSSDVRHSTARNQVWGSSMCNREHGRLRDIDHTETRVMLIDKDLLGQCNDSLATNYFSEFLRQLVLRRHRYRCNVGKTNEVLASHSDRGRSASISQSPCTVAIAETPTLFCACGHPTFNNHKAATECCPTKHDHDSEEHPAF